MLHVEAMFVDRPVEMLTAIFPHAKAMDLRIRIVCESLQRLAVGA